jgi:hypothetical protein
MGKGTRINFHSTLRRRNRLNRSRRARLNRIGQSGNRRTYRRYRRNSNTSNTGNNVNAMVNNAKSQYERRLAKINAKLNEIEATHKDLLEKAGRWRNNESAHHAYRMAHSYTDESGRDITKQKRRETQNNLNAATRAFDFETAELDKFIRERDRLRKDMIAKQIVEDMGSNNL